MHETPDITDDAILNGRLRLFQPKRGHRFGHDAILLAASVPARRGDRVAEFGAGVGAASLALLARIPDVHATLFEIDEKLCALARENLARNHMSHRAQVIHCDVMTEAADSPPRSMDIFHHIFMNPPFNDASLQASPDPARRQAHAGSEELLQNWVRRAWQMLDNSGAVTLIWRAEALESVLNALQPQFGGISIIPVYPAPDRAVIRIIVTGRKNDRSPLRIQPSLTLNDRDQKPTLEAENILRHGGAWPREILSDHPIKP